jgi:iron complex transport system substrate-binding protein
MNELIAHCTLQIEVRDHVATSNVQSALCNVNSAFAVLLLVALLVQSAIWCGCVNRPGATDTITVTDQLGRTVQVPRHVKRVTALHHFGGQIVFALKQQDKLVDQVLYGLEANALSSVDPHFAALPHTLAQESHTLNIESLVALGPEVAFAYSSFDTTDMTRLESAGIKVVAVRGETMEESFEAVRLMAKVLDCEEQGRTYLDEVQRLLNLVQGRLKDLAPEHRRRVVFTGPKSIYTVATGQMLQSQTLTLAGGTNLASELTGFWADVSPEQMATWDPEVILVGDALTVYGVEDIIKSPQHQTVKAVKNHEVYAVPSNIGWWDYPAPHCVLGVIWTAKTLYPDRFKDVDVLAIADDFYLKYVGHTFTAMGGRL